MILVTTDENTDISAMRSADEMLGYCATFIMATGRDEVLAGLKEAQRRLRRRTNPEMFNPDGTYR